MLMGGSSRPLPVLRGALPALLAIALLWAPSCRKAPRQATPTTTGAALSTLLPGANSLPGWDQASTPQEFGPDNLWEYINGQAESYLDYGFQQVVTSELSCSNDGRAVALEIYRMAAPEDAFGIFAAERTGDERPVELGVQGYVAANVVNFWKGPYYVKLTSYAESPGIEQAMTELARRVDSGIQGQYSSPPLLAILPEAHRVPSSERYIPRDFLGQPYLSRGYRADYDRDGTRYQMVLLDSGSPEEATRALDAYARFLEAQGVTVRRNGGPRDRSLRADHGGVQLLFQSGPLLGGVLGLDDPKAADEVAHDLLERCRREAAQ